MPVNKNALLRYKTIDNCLRNTGREWTLENLVDACSDALYEFTGRDENVSVRTVQLDIQKMRSEELGYNAPIEVYDKKYYRYSDPDFSITATPISESDLRQMSDAVSVLKQLSGFSGFAGMEDIVGRLEDHICAVRHERRPAIWFESNERLRGLNFITPMYEAVVAKKPVSITYRSFKARDAGTFNFSPYILKEYRNRWFVFGRSKEEGQVANLALDRIIAVGEASPEAAFIGDSGFNPEEYFRNIVGVTKIQGKNDIEETILFRAGSHDAPYIETKPLHSSQTVLERYEDGSVLFQINVCINYELERLLLGYGDGIVVKSPEHFVRRMAKILRDAARKYGVS